MKRKSVDLSALVLVLGLFFLMECAIQLIGMLYRN